MKTTTFILIISVGANSAVPAYLICASSSIVRSKEWRFFTKSQSLLPSTVLKHQSINQSINQIKSNQSIRKQSLKKPNPYPYSPAQYYNNQSINPINILVRCTQKSEHQNQSINVYLDKYSWMSSFFLVSGERIGVLRSVLYDNNILVKIKQEKMIKKKCFDIV